MPDAPAPPDSPARRVDRAPPEAPELDHWRADPGSEDGATGPPARRFRLDRSPLRTAGGEAERLARRSGVRVIGAPAELAGAKRRAFTVVRLDDASRTERAETASAVGASHQRAGPAAAVGVWLLSVDPSTADCLVHVNPALAEIFGASVEALSWAPLSSLAHREDYADISRELGRLRQRGSGHVEFEARLMHRDGHPVWTLICAALLSDAGSDHALAVTHVTDVSGRKRSERRPAQLADQDALTGLLNRRRFTEELTRALRRAQRFNDPGAVLFVDLDDFKAVNDALGRAAGDALISRVAGLLRSAVRATDIVARVGGDEFGLLLTCCDETGAVLVAGKLLNALRTDRVIGGDGGPRHVSSSVGIAPFRGDEDLSADEVVVRADIALYYVKNAGKDAHAVYDRIARRRNLVSVRRSWNDRLRQAISDDSFVLHAQPIAGICAHGTPGFELLLRLPDEDGHLIPPGSFLYSAERFGLIEQIDRLVLKRAVRRLHDSQHAGVDLMLSVNVSATTVRDPGLGGYVADLLSSCPVPPHRLMVEMTESAAIEHIESAAALAHQLRALGCKLALDDFGAGFASLSDLKLLEFDYLKIDGEYIRNLCTTRTDQLVVEAVVAIARALGTRTIAEFVGDDATVELLKHLGVDYAQGYHLGRPLPLDQRLPYLIAA